MALIHCPECTKEISDKVVACPHCGYPLMENNKEREVTPQPVEVTAVKLQTNSKTKKTIFVSIIGVVVLVGLVFGINAYKNQKAYNTYIDNLQAAQLLMISGGSDAEALCNLTGQVWRNAIYEDRDSETDKFTRPNGYFVSDFNAALSNLYANSSTKTTVSEIESNQEAVKLLIKDLQSPPKGLEKCYDTVTDLYSAYKGLTDLAVDPSGSLTSFLDSKSTKIDAFMEAYEKLSNQIPEKSGTQD